MSAFQRGWSDDCGWSEEKKELSARGRSLPKRSETHPPRAQPNPPFLSRSKKTTDIDTCDNETEEAEDDNMRGIEEKTGRKLMQSICSEREATEGNPF